MPRVHVVKNAAKDHLDHSGEVVIPKGSTYYWWKFRFGGRIKSLTRPKPQQLTRSAYYTALYDVDDMRGELDALETVEELEDAVQEIKDVLEQLGEEASDSQENMPESLQESPTGMMLEERADHMTEAVDELECIEFEEFDEDTFKADFSVEAGEEDLDPPEYAEMLKEALAGAQEEHLAAIVEEVNEVEIWGAE